MVWLRSYEQGWSSGGESLNVKKLARCMLKHCQFLIDAPVANSFLSDFSVHHFNCRPCRTMMWCIPRTSSWASIRTGRLFLTKDSVYRVNTAGKSNFRAHRKTIVSETIVMIRSFFPLAIRLNCRNSTISFRSSPFVHDSC